MRTGFGIRMPECYRSATAGSAIEGEVAQLRLQPNA